MTTSAESAQKTVPQSELIDLTGLDVTQVVTIGGAAITAATERMLGIVLAGSADNVAGYNPGPGGGNA